MPPLLLEKLAAFTHAIASSLSRQQKHSLLVATDICLFIIAITGSFELRFSTLSTFDQIQPYLRLIPLLLGVKIALFIFLGMYRPVLRYTGPEFLFTATKAVLFSAGTFVILAYLLTSTGLPRSILLADSLLTLLAVVSVRFSLRWLVYQVNALTFQGPYRQQVVIYGAGAAGLQLAQALAHDNRYRPVAFIDNDPSIQRQTIQGLSIYAPKELPQLLARKPFDAVLLAMPDADRLTRRRVLERLSVLGVPVKTVPSIGEIVSGQVSISEIRDIDIVDLLGREEVPPDPALLSMKIANLVVLVTGAGGSIGSELCRQVAQQGPKCLILYELSEYALYNIDLELAETYPNLKRVACLGSVTDATGFRTALAKYQVDTIYHAAAYKHVPLVEANPAQGVLNNVEGTLTAVQCAIDCGVSDFVLISTDKAVRPTNVMGASKRVAERIVQSLAVQPATATCLCLVRFGNVLDSSGSVVPRFRKQIVEGKPITVTHPDITRYFMSIPEAARLVIQAGSLASRQGEIFLLDMGEAVRIYDLAEQMIQLSGLVPGDDIEIQITGLRPGEKLYEELLIDSVHARQTRHPKIFCAQEEATPWEALQLHIEDLLATARSRHPDRIRTALKKLVPEYQTLPVGQHPKPLIKSGIGSEKWGKG